MSAQHALTPEATEHRQCGPARAPSGIGTTRCAEHSLTALAGLGNIYRMQGRYEKAADNFQRLLDLANEDGDGNWQFEAWQGLGRIQHATGHPDAALTHHHNALTLATELGQPDDQARAHDGLAHAHHALHQPEQARTRWQHALDILTRLGIEQTGDDETVASAIRTHLVNLDGGREGTKQRREP